MHKQLVADEKKIIIHSIVKFRFETLGLPMFPFRKSSNVTENNEELPKKTLQPQTIRKRRRRSIPVESPLKEYVVFSDSEEEREYVKSIHGDLPKSISSYAQQHVEVHKEVVELRDILKLLSTCSFENATRSELKDFIDISEWVKVKYFEENNNQSSIATSSKSLEKEQLPQDCDQLGVEPIKSNVTNCTINPESSTKKITDATKQKKIPNRVKKRKLNDMDNITENVLKNNNQIVPERSETLEDGGAQSIGKSLEQVVVKCDEKDNEDNVSTKFEKKKRVKNNGKQNNQSRKSKQQTDLKSSGSQHDFEILRKPLPVTDPRYSMPLLTNKNPKPLFASFQSHLKTRRLHSPSEWLNSEEFQSACEKR